MATTTTVSRASSEGYTLVNREEVPPTHAQPEIVRAERSLDEIMQEAETLYRCTQENIQCSHNVAESILFYNFRPVFQTGNTPEFFEGLLKRLEEARKNLSQANEASPRLREDFWRYDIAHQITVSSSPDYKKAQQFETYLKEFQKIDSELPKIQDLQNTLSQKISRLNWRASHPDEAWYADHCTLV